MKIRNAKALTKFINTTIAKNQQKLNESIQDAIATIAGHVYVHGDNTAIPTLMAVIKGSHKKAVLSWLQEFAFVTFDDKGNPETSKAKRDKASFENAQAVYDYCMSSECPKWYDRAETTVQAAKALNVASRLESLVKQIHSANDVEIDMQAIEAQILNLQLAIKNKKAA